MAFTAADIILMCAWSILASTLRISRRQATGDVSRRVFPSVFILRSDRAYSLIGAVQLLQENAHIIQDVIVSVTAGVTWFVIRRTAFICCYDEELQWDTKKNKDSEVATFPLCLDCARSWEEFSECCWGYLPWVKKKTCFCLCFRSKSGQVASLNSTLVFCNLCRVSFLLLFTE